MNIDVINLAQYEAPQIIESKQKGYVTFGENNSYFQFLIDRYRKSATNQSIINNVTRLMYGKGLGVIDASRKPSEYAQVMALFNKDCLRKLCFDLKTLGQCAIQVHYNDKHDKILKAFHIDMNLLAPEKCDDEGKINKWYYSNNWEDIKKFPPKPFATFGSSKDKVEILVIKPYSIGMKYFSLPDYVAGTAYALLEEEVSDYLIEEVQNRFSGTKVVNFNNGQPDIETQNLLQQQIKSKLTGSKGQRVIVGFNNNKETATTVDDIPLNDAPDLYNQLSLECERKIMVSHSITSGLLLGLGSANGFGSNADELKNAFVLFDNMVIRPLQQLLISGLEQITSFNGNTAKLFFDRLQPLDSSGDLTVDTENKKLIETINSLSPLVANKVIETLTPNEIRAIVGLKPEKGGSDLTNIETGTELSSQIDISAFGEEVGKDWVLIDIKEVDYENDDEENEILSKDLEPSLLSKVYNFISTGDARPNITSKQDKTIDGIKFLTRYVYAGKMSENSRDFCKAMMSSAKVYRKEDIIKMGTMPVNKGWGPKGADTYSVWLYKGGGDCNHRWNKAVYATFEGKAIDVETARKIAGKKAEKLGYKVVNEKLVSTLPKDMPFNGFLPTNKRFQ